MIGCGGGDTAEPSTPAAKSKPAETSTVAAAPAGNSTINGTITYSGVVPTLKPLTTSADPECSAKHTEPMLPEILVLGEGKTMANILVKVKGGLPGGKWPVPSDSVELDQKGCKYIPHVAAVMVGQTFTIKNSDGLLHNVHALPKVNTEFNMAMPANRTEAEKVFEKPEAPFRIKCDVHPWMGAYVEILDHPFHSVTAKDGKFSISGLPAGTYEIEAWHERLGTQSATVTVTDNGTETADFTFTR
jgi:plastocyanin